MLLLFATSYSVAAEACSLRLEVESEVMFGLVCSHRDVGFTNSRVWFLKSTTESHHVYNATCEQEVSPI